jgi:GrpB-like predicted nucleotidyltransferase (UPF0157 family)
MASENAQAATPGTAILLGLKNDVNLLADYDPSWVDAYAEEKGRLDAALGDVAKAIEHFGSTSVPGMRAKPILDIIVGVSPFEEWERCKAPLESLGYDFVANAGIPRHYIFGRGKDLTERTHILHIVDYNTEEWSLNLAFRDELRRDPALRAKYIAEKERAAAAAPEGRARYTALKSSFISGMKSRLGSIMRPFTRS